LILLWFFFGATDKVSVEGKMSKVVLVGMTRVNVIISDQERKASCK